MKEIIEAKIDLAIKAAVLNKGTDYEEKVIELRNQIMSIPEFNELLKEIEK